MKIAISAETTIDMPKELLEKYNIHTTAFTILLGEETKLDGELKSDEIFEYVQKTKILPYRQNRCRVRKRKLLPCRMRVLSVFRRKPFFVSVNSIPLSDPHTP